MKNIGSRDKRGVGRLLCALFCALLICSVMPRLALALSADEDATAGQATSQEQTDQSAEPQPEADAGAENAGAEGSDEGLSAQPEAAPSQKATPQEQTTQPMEPQSEAAEEDVEGLSVQSEKVPSQQLTTQDQDDHNHGRIEFNKGWSSGTVRAYHNYPELFSFSIASDRRVIINLQNEGVGRVTWKVADGTSDPIAAQIYSWDDDINIISANKSTTFDHYLKAGDYWLLFWGEEGNIVTNFSITDASTRSLVYPVHGQSSTSNPVGTLDMKSENGGTFLTYNDNRRMDYWRIDVPRQTQSLNVTCECTRDNLRVVDGVYVMDAQGNKIDALDMEGVASNTLTLNSLNAGTYYLRVATVNSSTVSKEGSYSIRWDATFVETSVPRPPSVQYYVHRQTYGNESAWSKRDGATSGTVGQGKRLEAIWIRLRNTPFSGGIQYRTHVQKIGWQGWRSNGAMSGTRGKSKRLEAIQIRLTGQMAQKYDVYYRVHAQKLGWMGWAKNGASAGTAGLSYRLEAIQIKIVPKGSTAGVGKSAMTSYAAKTATAFSTDDFTVALPKFLRKKFYLGLIRRTGGEVLWHFSTNVRKNSYLVYGGTLIVRSKNSPTRQYHYGYSKRGYSVDVGYGAQGLEDIFPSRYRKGSARVVLR